MEAPWIAICSIRTRYSPFGRDLGIVKVKMVEVVSKVIALVVREVVPFCQTRNQFAPEPSYEAAVEGALAM